MHIGVSRQHSGPLCAAQPRTAEQQQRQRQEGSAEKPAQPQQQRGADDEEAGEGIVLCGLLPQVDQHRADGQSHSKRQENLLLHAIHGRHFLNSHIFGVRFLARMTATQAFASLRQSMSSGEWVLNMMRLRCKLNVCRLVIASPGRRPTACRRSCGCAS